MNRTDVRYVMIPDFQDESVFTRSLQQVIARNAPANEIERQALSEGMSTLKLSVARHVLNGITSMSEMRKIVYEAGDQY